MSLLLGIDLGTSYFKVGLFDASGALRGLGRIPVETDVPFPGARELPVPRFWSLLRHGLHEALRESGAQIGDIAAVSYSSQANSFVLLDAADMPLTPIILWTDDRAEPLDDRLAAFSRRPEFAHATGFSGWSAGFAPPKWRWFQQHASSVWGRVRHVHTLPDFLTHRLTGERVVDASTASFLGLYHQSECDWWPEALALSGVAREQVATVTRPGTLVGRTTVRATELLGLPSELPYALGGIDHHVAALGSGLGRLADVSISTGTVLAAMMLVPAPTPWPDCFHGPDFETGAFFRLAFDPNGAGQLETYRRQSAPMLTLAELLDLAARESPAARPVGGEGSHGAAMRHLLEKVAAAQRNLLHKITAGAQVTRMAATGGGARSPLWLQIKADMMGVPIISPANPERACLGAAMLASTAAGWTSNLFQASESMVASGRIYEPDPRRVAQFANWNAC